VTQLEAKEIWKRLGSDGIPENKVSGKRGRVAETEQDNNRGL
jgi:hypothetical protein